MNLVVGEKDLKSKFKKMNSIVRKKNLKLKFKKLNLVVGKNIESKIQKKEFGSKKKKLQVKI
jgi:hypothetical protein